VNNIVAQSIGAADVIATQTAMLIFQKKPVSIGPVENLTEITLDACIRELHKASSKATRHPIESVEGAPATVTDHIIVNPLELSIDGVISNWPATYLNGLFSLGQDPVHDSHQSLLDDVLSGTIVTIATSLLEYPNMVLESVEVTRDAKKGNALHFTAQATQLTIVQMKEVVAAGPAKISTVSKGDVPPAPAAAPLKQSAAVKGGKMLGWLH